MRQLIPALLLFGFLTACAAPENGERIHGREFSAWVKQLESPSSDKRVEALIALGESQRNISSSVQYMTLSLSDVSESVRIEAAFGLSNYGKKAAPATEVLFTRLLTAESAEEVDAMEDALREIGPSSVPPALGHLSSSLSSEKKILLLGVMGEAGTYGWHDSEMSDDEVQDVLRDGVAALLHFVAEENSQVSSTAASAAYLFIGKLESDGDFPELVYALAADSDIEIVVRRIMVQCLGQFDRSRVKSFLIELADSSDDRIAHEASDVLGQLK